MNKMRIIFSGLMLVFIFIACEDNATDPMSETGTIYVESTPSGAEIWLDDVNTNEVTPGTVEASEGVHIVTLKKVGYTDLSITVSVIANQQFTLTSTSQTSLSQIEGTLLITSEPSGAAIWLDGVNTGDVTPKNFSLSPENHTVKLQFTDYSDTTFISQVLGGETVTENVSLSPIIIMYSAKIWESYGTTAAQPSGLDLSSGSTFGTSDVNNRGNIDLYYFSNSAGTSFLVQSSHLNANMSRETFFKVMASTNLNDGINAPVKASDWVYSVNESENNYMFLFNADNRYSKFRITNRGGLGTSDDPAWVEVQWYYNSAENNVTF